MSRQALGGVVVALSLAAALGFAAIAFHEFSYASDHPHAYGPAKVIAWGGVTGAVLALGVAVVGYVLARATPAEREF